MDNLGEYIRHQREAKNLTIDELSNKTKISAAVLRDIEAGRFDRYKGDEAYVKMYLKKITSVLNMDNESVTQQYIDLTKEIQLEELHEIEAQQEEHHEKGMKKSKNFSFDAPQLTRKKSVYEDKSHVTIIRTLIILVLVCLVIVVVWYGIYQTRSTSDDPNFVPGNNTTVEGDVTTPETDPTPENPDGGNTNTPTNAGVTFTRNGKLDFDFQLPVDQTTFKFKIEFMTKSWSKLYVNGTIYNDYEAKIYHNNDTEEPETLELEFNVAEFDNLRLQQGNSLGHRYYINGQLIPLIEEDSSNGVTYLKLKLVKE